MDKIYKLPRVIIEMIEEYAYDKTFSRRVINELREKIVYAKHYILFQFDLDPGIELYKVPISCIFNHNVYKIFKYVMLHKNHRLIDYIEIDPKDLY